MGERLESLLRIEPMCYMGIYTKEGIVIGPYLKFDSENNKVEFAKAVLFDPSWYHVKEEYSEPKTVKFKDEADILIGKYLLYNVGGEEKLDEILNNFNVSLTKDGWKKYKLFLKQKEAKKRKDKDVGLSLAERFTNWRERRARMRSYKEPISWSERWSNFKEGVVDTGKYIKDGYKFLAYGFASPAVDFNKKLPDWNISKSEQKDAEWVSATCTTIYLLPEFAALLSSGNPYIQLGGILLIASPTVGSVSTLGVKTWKKKKAKAIRKARILQAVCPLKYDGIEEVLE